jgi:hypothetical protein
LLNPINNVLRKNAFTACSAVCREDYIHDIRLMLHHIYHSRKFWDIDWSLSVIFDT